MKDFEKTGKTGKNVEQKENEFAVFSKGIIVILAPILIAFMAYALGQWSPWAWFSVIFSYIYIPSYILALVLVPLVLYFYWAKHNVIGYFIEEGYCIIFAWSGENFAGADLRYGKARFNENWDVETPETSEEKKPMWQRGKKIRIGGMGFYLWPFKRIYEYNMTWAKKTEKGERVSKTEKLSRVLLKPYVYSLEYQNMEDADRMPINIEIAAEMQIINPIKALFGVERWYRAILNMTEGEVRKYIGENLYIKLINRKSQEEVGEKIKEQMKNVLQDFNAEYGVNVKRIKVMQVVPSRKEDVEATLKAMQAERERERVIITAQAEAVKIGQELTGAVMQALSLMTGIKTTELQAEFIAAPEAFEKKYGVAYREAYDFAKRRMGFVQKGRIEIITADGCDKEGSACPNSGGINTDKLIEVIAAVEMTKQALSQRPGSPAREGSEKNPLSLEEKKNKLGLKY